MSDRMPEDMPDGMSEDLPVTKPINVMVGITRSKVICFFWCVAFGLAFHQHKHKIPQAQGSSQEDSCTQEIQAVLLAA
jgi:hypothetical protein